MDSTQKIKLNDPKTINGWALFDWANSSYALVITTALFPSYFLAVTDDNFMLWGIKMTDSAMYAFAVSAAYLLITLASPILSGIADYGGKKKFFLKFFTTLGAISCISLWFFTSMSTLALGTISFILATIGFAGGLVFYNAYLPLIATEDKYDTVSAQGFTYGYVGSIILLIVNLLIITYHESIGISESNAVRMAFVMVGLWWIGFAQISFKRMPKDKDNPPGENLIKKGFEELKKVWHQLKELTSTKRFLFSFFFYNAGVQTILFLAATFAKKELGFSDSDLIVLILILQLVAVAGAYFFAKISDWKGNKISIATMLVIWMLLCVAAFLVQEKLQMYILAGGLGSVMGGIQSMSRSTYSKLIPEDTEDTTSFFSFYDVIDKTSTMVGTFGFGLVQLLGGMRNAILGLSGFFFIGLLFLLSVQIKKTSKAVNYKL